MELPRGVKKKKLIFLSNQILSTITNIVYYNKKLHFAFIVAIGLGRMMIAYVCCFDLMRGLAGKNIRQLYNFQTVTAASNIVDRLKNEKIVH